MRLAVVTLYSLLFSASPMRLSHSSGSSALCLRRLCLCVLVRHAAYDLATSAQRHLERRCPHYLSHGVAPLTGLSLSQTIALGFPRAGPFARFAVLFILIDAAAAEANAFGSGPLPATALARRCGDVELGV